MQQITQANPEQLQAAIKKLEALESCEGWPVIRALMEGQRKSALQVIKTSKDATEIIRASGTLAILDELMAFVPMNLSQMRVQLKQILDQAQKP